MYKERLVAARIYRTIKIKKDAYRPNITYTDVIYVFGVYWHFRQCV